MKEQEPNGFLLEDTISYLCGPSTCIGILTNMCLSMKMWRSHIIHGKMCHFIKTNADYGSKNILKHLGWQLTQHKHIHERLLDHNTHFISSSQNVCIPYYNTGISTKACPLLEFDGANETVLPTFMHFLFQLHEDKYL